MTTIATIASVADVLPGYAVKGKVEHDPDGRFQVVLPRHLGDDPIYRYKPEDKTLMNLERNAHRYIVEPGDVLFVSRGTANRAAYLEELPEQSVATSVFYVLRAKGVEPRYLAWYLNQAQAQAAIAQVRTGAGTPIVQRQALMDMNIPVPAPEVQRRIAELDALMFEERQLGRRLLEQTEHYHRLVGQKLLATLNQVTEPT